MFRPVMLLAGLSGLLASGPASQNLSLQIIFPEKIQANTSDKSEIENKEIFYIIPIDEKPHTVHLQQRFFLADNFMVYLYNQGSMNSHSSNTQAQCYYQGYVEGYPNSIVTLSTCSGLRGLLQFENVSYGIEPLGSEAKFQHIIYKLKNDRNVFAIHTENNHGIGQNRTDYNFVISEKLESAVPDLVPLYLEMHIVVDKVLYDFLGSDSMIVTNKVIGIIGLVNSVFTQFKVTIVLSSLELWSDKNKISTVGEAAELLHRFLEWKKSYLTLRPHDVAYLFIYRDYPNYVGATFSGKMCVTHYSAGVVLYSEEITLEAFSVIVTQMLGLSLGISYDDPKKCQCSGAICIMNPEAMQFSGVKTFSSCSLSDFKIFISNMGAKCLQNKPQMQAARAAVCGNGRVESPEICDCGTPQQCGPNSCCDPASCVLKAGLQCESGSCCENCQFKKAHTVCRQIQHKQCDYPEECNGSSSICPPDITVLNGRICQERYVCYDGECHDTDHRCATLFGHGSRNAPFACYEEILSQIDRFGNCGFARNQYTFCPWRNLMCGRLICTYPRRTPFNQANVSVIYAFVQNVVCITLDHSLHGITEDKLRVPSGATCDVGRICIGRECAEYRFTKNSYDACSDRCQNGGVCNSLHQCVCNEGWSGENCTRQTRGAYRMMPGSIMEKAFWESKKNPWLLGFYIVFPVVVIAIVIAILWNRLKKRFTKEEESLSNKAEGSIHTYTRRSRSESSAQTYTNRSKSQETIHASDTDSN